MFFFLVGAFARFLVDLSANIAPVVGAALGVIIISPLVEEWLRALSLELTPKRGKPERWIALGVAHGLGFGLVEAVPRWIEPVGYAPGAFVPLALHVLLSLVFVRFSSTLFSAFTICIAIHMAHNAYVWLAVTNYSHPQFVLDVLLRLLVIMGAIVFVVRTWPRDPG